MAWGIPDCFAVFFVVSANGDLTVETAWSDLQINERKRFWLPPRKGSGQVDWGKMHRQLIIVTSEAVGRFLLSNFGVKG